MDVFFSFFFICLLSTYQYFIIIKIIMNYYDDDASSSYKEYEDEIWPMIWKIREDIFPKAIYGKLSDNVILASHDVKKIIRDYKERHDDIPDEGSLKYILDNIQPEINDIRKRHGITDKHMFVLAGRVPSMETNNNDDEPGDVDATNARRSKGGGNRKGKGKSKTKSKSKHSGMHKSTFKPYWVINRGHRQQIKTWKQHMAIKISKARKTYGRPRLTGGNTNYYHHNHHPHHHNMDFNCNNYTDPLPYSQAYPELDQTQVVPTGFVPLNIYNYDDYYYNMSDCSGCDYNDYCPTDCSIQ